MMGETRVHAFEFTWDFKEFSLSRKRVTECHKSPAFYVGPLKFDVSLYPRGKESGEYISLYVNRMQQEEVGEPGEISMDVTFSLKNFEDGSTLSSRESTDIKLNRNQCHGYEHFIDRELVVNIARDRYLPKDTLKIILEMIISYEVSCDQQKLKKGLENLSSDLKAAFENNIMTDLTLNAINGSFKVHKALLLARVPKLAEFAKESNRIDVEASVLKSLLVYVYSGKLDMSVADLPHKLYQTAKNFEMKHLEQKLLPVATGSYALTILKGERIKLIWTITDFLSRSRNERVFSPLLQSCSGATTMLKLIFCIEWDNEGNDIIVFYIKRLSSVHNSEEALFLACSICVSDSNGEQKCWNFFNHLYTNEEERKVQYLHKSALLKTPSVLKNDTVTFIFDAIINDKDDWSEVNGASFLSETENVNEVGQLASDIEEKLYRSTINYDVTFKSQGVEFLVHKFILASRSPVLRDMFERGDVKPSITDVSADTLGRMLLYMYTGKTDMYSYEIAENLYKVAGKYKIKELQVKCTSRLKDLMSGEQIYPLRILEVADQYSDEDLKMYTLNFLASDDCQILKTEHWKQFRDKKSELALTALEYILSKRNKKRLTNTP